MAMTDLVYQLPLGGMRPWIRAKVSDRLYAVFRSLRA